jgi:hypothetical protein
VEGRRQAWERAPVRAYRRRDRDGSARQRISSASPSREGERPTRSPPSTLSRSSGGRGPRASGTPTRACRGPRDVEAFEAHVSSGRPKTKKPTSLSGDGRLLARDVSLDGFRTSREEGTTPVEAIRVRRLMRSLLYSQSSGEQLLPLELRRRFST